MSGPLATILTTGRPKVRHGRFSIRVRFAAGAPAGTAVIELIRRHRTIGIARTRVLRGGTRRVRVKLTPLGRRLLRSPAKRLTRAGARARRAPDTALQGADRPPLTRLDGAPARR